MRRQGIISLSGVWFSYNGAQQAVIRDLDLDIPPGVVTAVLGPNGSGKTTLMRLILGSLKPRRGKVLLAQQPHDSYSRREMSQLVGLVPHEEHIPFELSVLEYVLLGRAPYMGLLQVPGKSDHHAAMEALQATGLVSLSDRPVPNLSGGERQLAVVARAIAQKPRILLLDEPTAHLDLSNQGRLLQILHTLSTEQVNLVLTTHDPNLAAKVANFVVLMRQGQVLDAGSAGSVLTAEALSAVYGVAVRVFEIGSERVILLA